MCANTYCCKFLTGTISREAELVLKLPRCTKFYEEACIKHFDLIDCSAAFAFCSEQITGPYGAISKYLDGVVMSMICPYFIPRAKPIRRQHGLRCR